MGSPENPLRELAIRVEDLERRLQALEGRSATESAAVASSVPVDRPSSNRAAAPRPMLLPLLGRTLLVMAGAFLLRTLTEGGQLPSGVGVLLGLLYAAALLLLADRDAGRERATSARFHVLTAAAIGYPLIWEATTRFELIAPVLGAPLVLVLATLGFAVAWRRRLEGLAWLSVLGAGPVSLAIGLATGHPLHPLLIWLQLSGITLWLAYDRGWLALGMIGALCADGIILLATVIRFLEPQSAFGAAIDPRGLVAVQLGLLLLYCGSISWRTFSRGRDIAVLEILQSLIALGIGLGGALVVARDEGTGRLALGVLTVGLAAGAYGVSFLSIDRQGNRRRNFAVFSSFALLLTHVGLSVLLPGAARSMVLALLAAGTAWASSRWSRTTLSLHAATYLFAGMLSGGLLAALPAAFLGRPEALDPWRSPERLLLLAALLVGGGLRVATHGRTWGGLSRIPRWMMLGLLALTLDLLLASVLAAAWESVRGTTPPEAALASLRTGTISVIVVALAGLARHPRFQDAAHLVHPLLILGGLKLLSQDLRSGEAATLFASLALFGSALIWTTRLRRPGGELASPVGREET